METKQNSEIYSQAMGGVHDLEIITVMNKKVDVPPRYVKVRPPFVLARMGLGQICRFHIKYFMLPSEFRVFSYNLGTVYSAQLCRLRKICNSCCVWDVMDAPCMMYGNWMPSSCM